ncbi:MAG TPA: hypothetical protein VKT33_13915 [Candidatus Angelobacter sp.]|nr:hypothetical protein [Candidatus Angelobacter sp.]
MKRLRPIVWQFLLLAICLAGATLALRSVDRVRGRQATLQDVLYIRSGKTLKRASLGYSGLLADIYWTRAVQYFGSGHVRHETRFDLLYPLLDITTDLDPHLIVAYEFGSIFLSQAKPAGAGQPEQAAALVEKGIRENPKYWRLYFTLGYIHYFDRKDYKAAAMAFQKGSEVPGAQPWMRSMAASMAVHAGEPELAAAIWRHIYESTEDEGIRQNAVQHLQALQIDQEIAELQRRVDLYRQKTGQAPYGWQSLIQAGLLRGVPRDPTNKPYILDTQGKVRTKDPVPFVTQARDRKE